MKRILTAAVLLAATSLVFSQPARAADNHMSADEQAVRKLIDELYAALGRNDVAALDRIYADTYTLVNEDGVMTAKAPRLAAIKSGELKYESISFDDVSIRTYPNAAVATLRVTSKGQSKGQEIGGRFRGTLTFLKVKGRWQLVAAQVSRIAG
jgi:ketosteroid isomerase-like protein